MIKGLLMLAAVCGDTVIWKPSNTTPLCAIAVQNIVGEVCDEMSHYKALVEELTLANFQLQMGRPRREVLHDLGVRGILKTTAVTAAAAPEAEHDGADGRDDQPGQQQQDPERGRIAGIGVEEGVLVNQGGEDFTRVGRAAGGHDLHDGEVHEAADPGQQDGHKGDALHRRQGNVPEAAEGVRPVDRGRLVQVTRDPLEPGEDADHEEREAGPDVDERQRPERLARVGKRQRRLAGRPRRRPLRVRRRREDVEAVAKEIA